jgi:hypothetical protein
MYIYAHRGYSMTISCASNPQISANSCTFTVKSAKSKSLQHDTGVYARASHSEHMEALLRAHNPEILRIYSQPAPEADNDGGRKPNVAPTAEWMVRSDGSKLKGLPKSVKKVMRTTWEDGFHRGVTEFDQWLRHRKKRGSPANVSSNVEWREYDSDGGSGVIAQDGGSVEGSEGRRDGLPQDVLRPSTGDIGNVHAYVHPGMKSTGMCVCL